MSASQLDLIRALYSRIIIAEIVPPHLVVRDTTLNGCPSVTVYVNDDDQDSVRATFRRSVFELVASDGVTQTNVLFATSDPLLAYGFIAGWVAAREHS